jgi:hypothetical protein
MKCPCPYFTYSLPSNDAECMATRVGDTGNGELERQGTGTAVTHVGLIVKGGGQEDV